jgi:TDG/mug DNA glycosylase family protein
LYTAWAGHHFARPGNRFWPALHAGGFTRRLYSPWEDQDLLELGLGLTNLVPRATAVASELRAEELIAGAARLERKLRRNPTRWIAFLGIGAYRTAFQRPRAALGPQEERIAAARIWLLPSPSGLNAHHQLPEIAAQFRALRKDVRREPQDVGRKT